MKKQYEPMFDTFTFKRGVSVPNRIMMAPMTNFASKENGEVSEEELEYYRVRSNGPGTVITAVAYVTRGGKGFSHEIGADKDQLIPGLARLASTIKDQGAKAILQIFHGGRMCPPEELLDGQPVSASAVAPLREGAVTPRELDHTEIEGIISDFGDATRRAIEAGFDGVEIHGANTYLIQQFFSPHSNRREDEWGGSLEKRMRFPFAVIDSVKKAVDQHAKNPFVIGYRISPEEMENPGIKMEDTLAFVDQLAEADLDYLHISVQDFWSGSMRDKEDKESRIVLIQDKVGARVPVIGVGSLHTPDEVMKAFDTGIPFVALGRELIMEPNWVKKVQEEKEDSIRQTLTKNDQKKLVVPDYLWNAIMNSPGWFPVEEK
ncbi:NADH-dependent flavin oxidoreductase [Salipaludibacillus neizhouensis]|uniref:NADH-dependent flavin oxidoreductase n=1 Tax=Salipaludibacillus neizhouensis TaxID=885475 RepID=A0A3A9K733_9BACI|nr:NADH-dependent flavin oxidoreductase [Salipaludibacillus neizhouensis]RKL66322.1 NADH-dependent flavin oxidoreductase [Salipaludibacillus neizhouensis]